MSRILKIKFYAYFINQSCKQLTSWLVSQSAHSSREVMEKRFASGTSEKPEEGKAGSLPTKAQKDSKASSSETHYATSIQEIQEKRKQIPTDLEGSSSGTSAADSLTRYATKLPSQQNDSSDSNIESQATPESGQRSFSLIQLAPATQTKETEKARTNLGEISSGIATEKSLTGLAIKISEKQKQTDSSGSDIKIEASPETDDRNYSDTQPVLISLELRNHHLKNAFIRKKLFIQGEFSIVVNGQNAPCRLLAQETLSDIVS